MQATSVYKHKEHRFIFLVSSILFVFFGVLAFAQETYDDNTELFKDKFQLAAQVHYSNTSSGHKSAIAFGFEIKKNKHSFFTSMLLNNETYKVDGVLLRYARNLVPNSCRTSFYLQTNASIRIHSPLRKKIAEKIHDVDFTGAFEKYTTLEMYVGAGFRQTFYKRFSAQVDVALGGYSRMLVSDTDCRCKHYVRYGNDIGMGLSLQLSLVYQII